jgi:hypothetical protein
VFIRAERAHRGDNRVVHQDRGDEPLSAVDHAVTGAEQVNTGVPGLGQVLLYPGHHIPVSASGKPFLDCCRRKPLDPQQCLRRVEPLADPPMRRSPLSGSKSANLTDELPELSTSTSGQSCPRRPGKC